MDVLRVFVMLNTQKLLRVFMRMPWSCSSKYSIPRFGDTWHTAFMTVKSMMSIARKRIIHGRAKKRMSTAEQTAFCVSRI